MMEFLIPALAISLAVAEDWQPTEEALCSSSSVIVETADRRMYRCPIANGSHFLIDITPPDDETHWKLNFGSLAKPPEGAGSYHPVQDWPFRSISTKSALHDEEYFYVFDRAGRIVESSEADAVGQHMTEVRQSGLRIWPTANVYYRLSASDNDSESSFLEDGALTMDVAKHALVVDGRMLCPALDETGSTEWNDGDNFSEAFESYINGHCKDAERHVVPKPGSDQELQVYYTYRVPSYHLQPFEWSFQRHDEPEQPVRNSRGDCVAQCTPLYRGP